MSIRPRLSPTIDRFLAANFFGPFMVCLAAFTAAYLLGDIFDRFDTLVHHGGLGVLGLEYFALKIPLIVTQLLPIACLAGVLLGFALLNRTGEVLACQQLGISRIEMMIPVLLVGILISGISVCSKRNGRARRHPRGEISLRGRVEGPPARGRFRQHPHLGAGARRFSLRRQLRSQEAGACGRHALSARSRFRHHQHFSCTVRELEWTHVGAAPGDALSLVGGHRFVLGAGWIRNQHHARRPRPAAPGPRGIQHLGAQPLHSRSAPQRPRPRRLPRRSRPQICDAARMPHHGGARNRAQSRSVAAPSEPRT